MEEILREIGMIARALDSISNIEFKEYDLTKGQYLYLVRICENPGIIQEKLAEMIKVDRTTAARAIKKLELNGFIEKKADHQNKKIKKLFVTILTSISTGLVISLIPNMVKDFTEKNIDKVNQNYNKCLKIIILMLMIFLYYQFQS